MHRTVVVEREQVRHCARAEQLALQADPSQKVRLAQVVQKVALGQVRQRERQAVQRLVAGLKYSPEVQVVQVVWGVAEQAVQEAKIVPQSWQVELFKVK